MTLRLRLLGTVFEIRTDEPVVAALLGRLWKPFETSGNAPAHETFTIERDDEGLVVRTSGEAPPIHHRDAWGLTDSLRYRMLELMEARIEGVVTLHAAAVARDGRLLLLAGPSGTGKTTLTLGLLGAGWTYFSDDVAPLGEADGTVLPFPKPLGVKDTGLFDSLAPCFEGLALPRPSKAFLVPPGAFPVGDAPLAPRCLAFPRFDAGASCTVTPLTAAKATALATSYVRRLDPGVVGVLNRLCSGCDCFEVVYGSTEDGVEAMTELTAGTVRRST